MRKEYFVIQERYKGMKAGENLPDVYNLRRISEEFNISTDYILGLTNEFETKYLPKDVTSLFNRYKQMQSNPIKDGEDYYWIKLELDENNSYVRSTQTMWVGFTEDGREIRMAREVIPEKAIELCKKIGDIPVIINKVSEIGLFYLFGGTAMISKKLCKEHLPEILEPKII